VDDRGGGRVLRRTFAELNLEVNQLAHALLGIGIRAGDKIVWCGQNSPGLVRMIHAARKLAATAVPLNYRLSPEEAAYVVDDCDAVLVYTDAEFASLFATIRAHTPKVRHVMVFDGTPA